jgi:hypothetical protein
MSFKLIKQETQQVIILKQFHNSLMNINPINYYLMAATNKLLSAHGAQATSTLSALDPRGHRVQRTGGGMVLNSDTMT